MTRAMFRLLPPALTSGLGCSLWGLAQHWTLGKIGRATTVWAAVPLPFHHDTDRDDKFRIVLVKT